MCCRVSQRKFSSSNGVLHPSTTRGGSVVCSPVPCLMTCCSMPERIVRRNWTPRVGIRPPPTPGWLWTSMACMRLTCCCVRSCPCRVQPLARPTCAVVWMARRSPAVAGKALIDAPIFRPFGPAVREIQRSKTLLLARGAAWRSHSAGLTTVPEHDSGSDTRPAATHLGPHQAHMCPSVHAWQPHLAEAHTRLLPCCMLPM
jgi:hypothetical protein